MPQTYLTRQKKPAEQEADRPKGRAEVPSPAGLGGSVPEGGMGDRLAGLMQARMAEHFGGGSAAPEGLDGVQVHYNSTLPGKVDAEAYTQGDHIYLAAGQEHHLPHELGHVVQQRRGHVPTTERISGLAANTNPALEHEADVLGQQFAGVTPEISGGVGTFGAAPSAVDAAAPIQMAGHKGVMQFGNGTIIKRIEKNEYDEYCRVMEQQTSMDVDPATRRRALAAFPRIYGVYTQAEAESGGAFPGFEGKKAKQLDGWIKGNGKDLQEARKKAGGAEPENEEGYYVQMESMGGDGFAIKDFKVGTFTANAEELYQHSHKGSRSSALKKEKKMRKNDDARSETARYGLRDSDEIQKHGNPLRKFLAGQRLRTLDKTRKQVKGGRYNGGGGDVSQVIQDLEDIEEYFMNSDTVYVASSVIIKWAKEGGGDRDQARLIDLAHPVRRGKASDAVFEAARDGMLLGIRNVKNLLLGNQLQEAGESKLPIGVGNLESKTPGGEKAHPAIGLEAAQRQEQANRVAATRSLAKVTHMGDEAHLGDKSLVEQFYDHDEQGRRVAGPSKLAQAMTAQKRSWKDPAKPDSSEIMGFNDALGFRKTGSSQAYVNARKGNVYQRVEADVADYISAVEQNGGADWQKIKDESQFGSDVMPAMRGSGSFATSPDISRISTGALDIFSRYADDPLIQEQLREQYELMNGAEGYGAPKIGSQLDMFMQTIMNKQFGSTFESSKQRLADEGKANMGLSKVNTFVSTGLPLMAKKLEAGELTMDAIPEHARGPLQQYLSFQGKIGGIVTGNGGQSAPAPKAAPAPAPKTAPAPKAAKDEPTVEELKQMAQNGVSLSVAQRTQIFGNQTGEKPAWHLRKKRT